MGKLSKLFSSVLMASTLGMGMATTYVVEDGGTTSVDLRDMGDKIDSKDVAQPSSVVALAAPGVFKVHIRDNGFLNAGDYTVEVGVSGFEGDIHSGSRKVEIKKPCDSADYVAVADGSTVSCDLGTWNGGSGTALFDQEFLVRFDHTAGHLGRFAAQIDIKFTKDGSDAYSEGNGDAGDTSPRVIKIQETYTASGLIAEADWSTDSAKSLITSDEPQTTAASTVTIDPVLKLEHATLVTPSTDYIDGSKDSTSGVSASNVDFSLISLELADDYKGANPGRAANKAQDLSQANVAGALDTSGWDATCISAGSCPVVFKWAPTGKVYDLGIERPLAKYFDNAGGCGLGDCRGSIKAEYGSLTKSGPGFTFSSAAADTEYDITSTLAVDSVKSSSTSHAEDLINSYPALLSALFQISSSKTSMDLDGVLRFTAPTTSDAISGVSGCTTESKIIHTFPDLAAADAWLQGKVDACQISQPTELVGLDAGVTVTLTQDVDGDSSDDLSSTSNKYYRFIQNYARLYNDISSGAAAKLQDALSPAEDTNIAWEPNTPTCGAVTLDASSTHAKTDSLPTISTCAGDLFTLDSNELDFTAQASGCVSTGTAANCKEGDYAPNDGFQCWDAKAVVYVDVTSKLDDGDSRITGETQRVTASIEQLAPAQLSLSDITVNSGADSTGAIVHAASTPADIQTEVKLERSSATPHHSVSVTKADQTVSELSATTLDYNCEGAAFPVSYEKEITLPCGNKVTIAHSRLYRAAFSAAQLKITSASAHSGTWTIAEKDLYDQSSAGGVDLEIKASGVAADFLRVNKGARLFIKLRAHDDSTASADWVACTGNDSGVHTCAVKYVNTGRSNIIDGQNDDVGVQFDFGLQYEDCAAGDAQKTVDSVPKAITSDVSELTLTVTPSGEPYTGQIKIFGERLDGGFAHIETLAKDNAAFPADTVEIDIDRDIEGGGTLDKWEPEKFMFQFFNSGNDAQAYKIDVQGGDVAASEAVQEIAGGVTNFATVNLDNFGADQCTTEGSDAFPNLEVTLTPCSSVTKVAGQPDTCAPADLVTAQARTFELHVNCIARAAKLYLMGDSIAESSGSCEDAQGNAVSGCLDVESLTGNVLSDEWIARTSATGIELRFQQVGTGKTDNDITVSGGSGADQTVTLAADAASVSVQMQTDSSCAANAAFSISTDSLGSLDSLSGALQVRCVRSQQTAAEDSLILSYDISQLQLNLKDDQVLTLAPTPAQGATGAALTSSALLGQSCSEESSLAAGSDCRFDGESLKSSVAELDASAFLDYLEDCGASNPADDATAIVREINVIRTYQRTKHSALSYCEARKVRYEVVKSDSATVAVGIADPQQREFRVQIEQLKYESCDASGSPGKKLRLEMGFEMKDSSPGATFQPFEIDHQTGDFSECLDTDPTLTPRCYEKAAYSVSMPPAFVGGQSSVSTGHLLFEGTCHPLTSTCGGLGHDFRTDAQSSSFAIVHTSGGQQYAALVSVESQIDCPIQDEEGQLDDAAATLTAECDESGGTGYAACAQIPAEASLRVQFADASGSDFDLVVDTNTMEVFDDATNTYGAAIDLRDFSTNGLTLADYVVNGQLSVLSGDFKTLQIMVLKQAGKTLRFSSAYSRNNTMSRRLRSYILSADGSVETSLAILPATTEVVDHMSQEDFKDLNTTEEKLDELHRKGEDSGSLTNVLAIISLSISVFLSALVGCMWWCNKKKWGAVAGGKGEDTKFQETTPLFSRFTHKI